MCKVKDLTSFRTLIEVSEYFKTETKCLSYLEKWGWQGMAYCRECGSNKLYKCEGGKLMKCGECPNSFSLKTGTIFENSKLPLRKWYMAIFLLCNNKKGISSRQLAGYIGVTQKTSWMMMHKIRSAMPQEKEKMKGTVAIDECFIGGANGNRHIDKKVKNKPNRIFKDKHTVHGFVDGNGKVRCLHIKSTQNIHLHASVKANIEEGSTIITDEWVGYKRLCDHVNYNHMIVNHQARKFLSSEGGSTNAVESVWSHLKRMMYGTYNMVSAGHLKRYLDEYTFRYNNRHETNEERFRYIFGSLNNPITYKMLINGKKEHEIKKEIKRRENIRLGKLSRANAFFRHRSKGKGEDGGKEPN